MRFVDHNLGFLRGFTSAFLSYTLVILLCAPFAVQAAPEVARDSLTARDLGAAPPAASSQTTTRRDGELLVRFRAGVSEQDKATTIASHGSQRKKRLRGDSGIEKLELSAGQDAEVAAQQLRLNPAVEFVEPNFLIRPDDLGLDKGNARKITPQPFQPNVSDTLNPALTGSYFGDSSAKVGFSASNSVIPSLALQPQGPQVDDPRFEEQWALSNTGQSGGQFGSDISVAMRAVAAATTLWKIPGSPPRAPV